MFNAPYRPLLQQSELVSKDQYPREVPQERPSSGRALRFLAFAVLATLFCVSLYPLAHWVSSGGCGMSTMAVSDLNQQWMGRFFALDQSVDCPADGPKWDGPEDTYVNVTMLPRLGVSVDTFKSYSVIHVLYDDDDDDDDEDVLEKRYHMARIHTEIFLSDEQLQESVELDADIDADAGKFQLRVTNTRPIPPNQCIRVECFVYLPSWMKHLEEMSVQIGDGRVVGSTFGKLSIGDFVVHTTAGNVVVSDVKVKDALNVTTKTGEIFVKDVKVSQTTLASMSGAIHLSNASVDEKARVRTASGQLHVGGVTSKALSVTSFNGPIKVTDDTTTFVGYFATTSASIDGALTIQHALEVNSLGGAIDLDVGIDGDKGDGAVYVKSRTVTGPIKMNLSPHWTGQFMLRSLFGSVDIAGDHLEFDDKSKHQKEGRRFGDEGSGNSTLTLKSSSGHIGVTFD